ncbi:MAG: hypothetical protein AAGG81_03105 [Chlamydiota bacterium]
MFVKEGQHSSLEESIRTVPVEPNQKATLPRDQDTVRDQVSAISKEIMGQTVQVGSLVEGKPVPPDPHNEQLDESIKLILHILDAKIPEIKKNEFIEFVKTIANKKNEKSEKKLGMIIYLLDTHSNDFCGEFSTKTHKELLKWVKTTFMSDVNAIKIRMTNLCLLNDKTKLQSSELIYQTRIPLEIAQILVTTEGSINCALAESINDYLIPNSKKKLAFHQNIIRVLQLLKRSPDLRKKLSNISTPKSPYSLANHLIRIQVEKSYEEPILKRDAIVTALTACLSHLRQGPVGSCFATHFAIVLLSSHIERCLDDFQMLLHESKLTRRVNDVTKDFPFLLRMGNDSSKRDFEVTKNARVIRGAEPGGVIWEVPGLAAACKAINVTNPKKIFLDLISEYSEKYNTLQGNFKWNIETLLSLICDHQLKQFCLLPSKKMKMYALAHFAFEAKTRNGLLSVWENSIAEMAEGKDESMIIQPLYHAIKKPILQLINESYDKAPFSKEIKNHLSLILSKNLKNRLHLHYDPNIFNNSIDSERMSSEGGYVIYDTMKGALPNQWKRIDTPLLYSAFVASVFDQSEEEILHYLSDKYPEKYHPASTKKIQERINTTQYAHESMITFYPHYKHNANLVENWKQYKYTPWVTLSGNLADRVREVYMEQTHQHKKEILKPIDAVDLFTNILNYVKNLSNEEVTIYQKNPNKRIPIFTTTHAFTLLIGNPRLQRFYKSKLSPKQWVKKHLIDCCNDFIKITIDRKTQSTIIKFTTEELVTPSKQNEFLKSANLLPTDVPYAKFRSHITKLLEIIDNGHPRPRERVQKLDQEILSTLPQEFKNSLSKVAIHFADTNWSNGFNDVHLCVTFNPCTGEVEVMQIQDNGEEIQPAKQHWLLNQDWELISDTKTALPKDDCVE